MPKTYDEIMAARRARSGPESQARRPIFAEAYDIAMQVIELREKAGLAQAQLAELCGVNQADISRIERGSTSSTSKTLQRIAEALGADVRLVAKDRRPTT